MHVVPQSESAAQVESSSITSNKLPLALDLLFTCPSISCIYLFIFTNTLSVGYVFLIGKIVSKKKSIMPQCLLLKTAGSFRLHKRSIMWAYLQVNIRDKLEVLHDVRQSQKKKNLNA